MSEISFDINGLITRPKQGDDIGINVSFVQESAEFSESRSQPSIEISALNFVNIQGNKAAKHIVDYRKAGITGGLGITQGMPAKAAVQSDFGSFDVFDGFLDFFGGYIEMSDSEIEVNLKSLDSISNIEARSKGITMLLLQDEGVLNQSHFIDIGYILEKPFNLVELALLSLTIYNLVKQQIDLVQQSVNIITAFTETISIQVVGVGVATSPLAAALGLALRLAALTAASIALTFQLIKLTKDLIDRLAPPTRYHKGVKMKTLLEVCFGYIGYTFESSIIELNNIAILPSTDKEGSLQQNQSGNGAPKTTDPGYRMFDLINRNLEMFYADLFIDHQTQTAYMEPFINTNFWSKTSSYVMPSTLIERTPFYENGGKSFNINEISQYRLISFDTDSRDVWTLRDRDGYISEVHTIQITTTENRAVGVRGTEDILIPYALGSRKDSLNKLEEAIKNLLEIVDSLINALGGNSTLAGAITGRKGRLKLENHEVQTAKIIYLNSSGKLPSNHRDLWSSRLLETKYHSKKSFVQNNFGGQYELYRDVKIPLEYRDAVKIINNSYFTIEQTGEFGKFDKLEWFPAQGFGVADFRIQKPWTYNLTEKIVS